MTSQSNADPTKSQRDRVVELLKSHPDFATETDRTRLLKAAFGGIEGAEPIFTGPSLSGGAGGAAVELVDFLAHFGSLDGQHSLSLLLHELRSTVGDDRKQIFLELIAELDQLASGRSLKPDFERLRSISQRALDDIRTELGGMHLARSALLADLKDKLAEARLVEVIGEAGSGKSALLKELAQPMLDEGPVLFLSSKRMPVGVPGWEGLAAHWHLSVPLQELVAELATTAQPCLFIDGIERLDDPGAWLAVNDLLRAIRHSPSANRWTLVLSARSNSLAYRTHLDLDDLAPGAERILVGDFSAEEVAEIGAAHPHLAPLIAPGGRGTALAARPYLLDRLIRAGTAGLIGEGPVSEIDLMLGLWTGTASDAPLSSDLVLARQDALLALGRQRLAAPARPLTSIGVERPALLALVQNDLLRHDTATREVTFVHDILEDWTLCQTLNHESGDPVEIINGLGQPLWLLDAVQLLAQWRLEQQPADDAWLALLKQLSRPPLQPRWRRAVLTAPLQSTRTSGLLAKVTETLWIDDASLLAELMVSMRTIEVEPDPLALDVKLYPDYDDVTRMQLAQAWAIPRMRTWRHFFPWLIQQLDRIPPGRVEETTRVLETWAQSWHIFPAWAANPIARWARDWLARVERRGRSNSYQEVATLLNTMGVGHRDEDALRNRLRLLIVTAADGSREQVAEHLRLVAADPDHNGAKFFIQSSNWLVQTIPTELVDFLLAVMLRNLTEETPHHWRPASLNELGIEFDDDFFPASHLRPPFLSLLRQHPDQGLRLVNSLCNHAMTAWCGILAHERGATPLPVCIRFPWGERQFWGHAREYTWFRGTGPGPRSVESALMALELWMEEQVAQGADMEELFHQVLEDNTCIGTVGACISLALANPKRALKAALPLAASPQLWYWDLTRRTQELGDSMSNLIGNLKDRGFLRDVAKRNRLPHRQGMLRDLALYYLTNPDQSMRKELIERLTALEACGLPFDFAAQQADLSVAEELRERIRRMQAELSSENWKTSVNESEQHVLIQYAPPADLAPPAAEVQQHEELTRAMKVALWAEKSLEANEVQPEPALTDAIAMAKDFDLPDLFDHPPDVDNFVLTNRVGAVAGTAAMALKFAEPSDGLLDWGREVIYRAVGTPLDTGPLVFAHSEVMFHPVVFSATALTGLVERGLATEDERQAVLDLVSHPLLKVVKTVFRGLAACWEQDPLLCWQAFVLGVRMSVEPWSVLDERRGDFGLARPEAEIQWLLGIHDEIEADWRAGRYSTLPSIPLPWVLDDGADRTVNDDPYQRDPPYRRSELAFHWDIAPVVLASQPIAALLATAKRKDAVLRLTSDLLAWTIMDTVPPFERQHGGRAYEWGQTFLEWCARLTEHLAVSETETTILAPIRAVSTQRDGGHLLENLMFGCIRQRFSQDRAPNDLLVQLWGHLCDMLFAMARKRRSSESDWIGQGFDECVPLAVFSFGGLCFFNHPWPTLDAVRPTLERWVDRFGESASHYPHLTVFLGHAGRGLFPQPALGWLHGIVEARRNDQQFWRTSDNGSKTAAVLGRMLDDHSATLACDHHLIQTMIAITDVLIAHGVRQAAQLQQLLAALTDR